MELTLTGQIDALRLMLADRIERDGEALATVDELTAVLALLTAAADRATASSGRPVTIAHGYRSGSSRSTTLLPGTSSAVRPLSAALASRGAMGRSRERSGGVASVTAIRQRPVKTRWPWGPPVINVKRPSASVTAPAAGPAAGEKSTNASATGWPRQVTRPVTWAMRGRSHPSEKATNTKTGSHATRPGIRWRREGGFVVADL